MLMSWHVCFMKMWLHPNSGREALCGDDSFRADILRISERGILFRVRPVDIIIVV